MPVSIAQSVGEGGINSPNDVVQIDALLHKIGMLPPICPLEKTRNDAIRRFQEIWGLRSRGVFDGKIDPGGGTLAKLNATAAPLALKPIVLGMAEHGAYLISFAPAAPPAPYRLWLGVWPVAGEYIDVTGASSSDVMTKDNLASLLELIKRKRAWGTPLQLRLYVALDNRVISESNPQNFICPVQPHNGKLLPLDEVNNGAKLTYQGNATAKPPSFWGRMFHQVAGYEGYFFKYGGMLETDAAKRGFDCITYAGTVCGAPTTRMAASSDLVAAMGATACTVVTQDGAAGETVTTTLDSAQPKYVKEFFKTNTTGSYLMYSGGHIVVVVDGVVHEFSSSKQGYAATAVATWLEPQVDRLTVRKLANKPALAT